MSQAEGERTQGTVAVFDVGKTNIKLNFVAPDGRVVETLSRANPVVEEPRWRRHALAETEAWLFANLAAAARHMKLGAFIASGHGSAGVLVRADEIDASEPALPMIDYEQTLPEAVREAYAREAGSFFDRGSAVMLGATHQARQMSWVSRERPADFASADAFLGVPQYWAWRLSGRMAGEVTYLGAQSHLWNVPEARPAALVERHGWTHLFAPMRHAYDELGPVRAELTSAYGLPEDMRVFTGVHDSSANFYRYQVLGLSRMTVVSTGTWIVALSDHADLAALDETRGMTCNADIEGRPLGGCLAMGGRDFSHIAGEQPAGAQADEARLRALALRGTMALPSFGQDDGLFPGSATRGRIVGPAPEDAADRLGLAVLYAALLTTECLDALGSRGTIILDGTFLRDPLYARLVAALRPDETVLYNEHGDGIAAGAALLARRDAPVPDTYRDLRSPAPLAWPELMPYAARWRVAANDFRDDRSPN